MSKLLVLACLTGACCVSGAQATVTANQALPSSSLPGNGLAQHDFLYAGESHNRQIFIVRRGKIVWSYNDSAGKGEVSDAVMLSNGNVLFTHQYGVTEISPQKKVIWNYDAPAGNEIHTAIPIGKERVLYIQNGDPALLRVVNMPPTPSKKRSHSPSSVHPARMGSSVMPGSRTKAHSWSPTWI